MVRVRGVVIASEIAIKGLQLKFDGDMQTLFVYSRVDVVELIQILKNMKGFEDGVNSGRKMHAGVFKLCWGLAARQWRLFWVRQKGEVQIKDVIFQVSIMSSVLNEGL